jgi:hypothetical protein
MDLSEEFAMGIGFINKSDAGIRRCFRGGISAL